VGQDRRGIIPPDGVDHTRLFDGISQIGAQPHGRQLGRRKNLRHAPGMFDMNARHWTDDGEAGELTSNGLDAASLVLHRAVCTVMSRWPTSPK